MQPLPNTSNSDLKELSSQNSQLKELLKNNLLFHAILNWEIQETPWGQITINVQLKDGIAQIDTINIVKNRRKKYET